MKRGMDFLTKRLRGLVAILLFLMALLMFVPSLELQVVDVAGEDVTKEFSSASYVSVPDSYRSVTDALQAEQPDFDYNGLCGKVMLLLVGAVVCAVFSLRIKRSIVPMLLAIGLSAYGIATRTGAYSFYFAHEKGHVFHIVLMALIGLLALLELAMSIRQYKNEETTGSIHTVLSDITAVLMLVPVCLMFLPFGFQPSGATTSIMGYVLFPANHSLFGAHLAGPSVLGAGYNINIVVLLPLLVFIIGILGSFFALQSGTKWWTTLMPIAWSLIGGIGFSAATFLTQDPNRLLYIGVFISGFVLACINLVLHVKRYQATE